VKIAVCHSLSDFFHLRYTSSSGRKVLMLEHSLVEMSQHEPGVIRIGFDSFLTESRTQLYLGHEAPHTQLASFLSLFSKLTGLF
jgi:hypothetical protein